MARQVREGRWREALEVGSHFRPELSADVGVEDGYEVERRSRII